MTGPIGHAASSQVPPEAPAPAVARPPPSPAHEAAAPPQEAVTLSAEAQATTQLFQAAREADGVNQENVQRIRVALQNGSYDVAPEVLAASIVSALKEQSA